jgi:hypothetical protein
MSLMVAPRVCMSRPKEGEAAEVLGAIKTGFG